MKWFSALAIGGLLALPQALAQTWSITPPQGSIITDQGVNGQGQLQFTVGTTPQSLPTRSYVLGTGLLALDAAFGCSQSNGQSPVELYPISGADGQVWIWNGSTLQSRGMSEGAQFCGASPAVAGSYLGDQGGNPVLVAAGDGLTIQSVTGGYTIQNQVTGHYLSGTGGQGAGMVKWVSTPFVWTAH